MNKGLSKWRKVEKAKYLSKFNVTLRMKCHIYEMWSNFVHLQCHFYTDVIECEIFVDYHSYPELEMKSVVINAKENCVRRKRELILFHVFRGFSG